MDTNNTAAATLNNGKARIVLVLQNAPSKQLNQRTIARRLGCKASELCELLTAMRTAGMVTAPYAGGCQSGANIRESPSARTYQLAAGYGATFNRDGVLVIVAIPA